MMTTQLRTTIYNLKKGKALFANCLEQDLFLDLFLNKLLEESITIPLADMNVNQALINE